MHIDCIHILHLIYPYPAGGGVCEPFSLNVPYGVCRNTSTIGLELLFINKSIAEQEVYDRRMRDIEIAIEDYSDECRDVFLEYLCVTNFPQCDLSHIEPRPLMVGSHKSDKVCSKQLSFNGLV